MAKVKGTILTGRRWQFAWCEFDEISRTLTVRKQPVKLEAKPLDVLTYLLEHPAETVSKEELLDTVWGNTTEQSLAVAISKLRKAFGGDRDAIILNVPGVGYRMAVQVVCIPWQQPAPLSLWLEPGQTVPGRPEWQVVQRLGRGDDTSPVWLAEKKDTAEQRVFKFANDGIHLRALQREVVVSRLLEKALGGHPKWAVRILDRWFEDPPFFIASEYAGVDLLEWSTTPHFREMKLERRIQLAAEIADGVAAAHSVGILHNDLKPSNILLIRSEQPWETNGAAPSSWHLKIADFGVASIFDDQRLREMDISDYGVAGGSAAETQSTPVGTAMYRAPELHAGNPPTMLGDVYSLGLLLYQIVIGDFTQQLSPGWEVRVPDLLLRADIAKAAEVDPAHRLVSASELAWRLHQLDVRRREWEKSEAARQPAHESERVLERARLRRPWMILAFATLIAGLCVSLSLYRRALSQKNLADARLASFEQMYGFMARDLLGQSNPFLNVPGANVPGQTLVDAIQTALPRIDQRFAGKPAIAGRLHATIGDAFRARAQYPAADNEYEVAAQRFREDSGELSPDAILTELKREDTQMVSLAPGAIDSAKAGFARQQPLIAKLRDPNPELQAWEALVGASITGLSSKPGDGLPPLEQAIQKAEGTPGFDPLLLITMKKRICGIYLRMGNGAAVERIARGLVQSVVNTYGADSPSIAPFQMYIQEGLYLQGKYKAAIAQADSNFAQFTKILGPEHNLTLATLANRAASEGQLGLYEAAARDDLKLYTAERALPSPSRRFEMGSLADAAMFECRAGHFQEGNDYARQVVRETSSGPAAMPVFAAQATFTIAECAIGELEGSTRPSPERLNEAEALLDKVDPKINDPLGELGDYAARIDLAHARIALLRKDEADASKFASRTADTFQAKDADPYEKAALERIERAIAARR
ncbi:serine/threonine protein kinase [Acidisarcina polymorpha]|uniref:Serine/threonine protein kinase n=1 Tax=Acidisarcina polymorpha TaxID=2211140 RepID=A0A2Z5G0J0_9BACT|nr:winged helix-turn-helix domain-containing protein [Acidisarcina polymorpha]AXC12671.1 serine/threonine protein kinase [Acidisarcina polymorpha]